MVANPCRTTYAVLLWRREDHRSLRSISVRVPLLPLGKSVLPVVLLESGEACNTVHTEVYNSGVCILLGKVAEVAEHKIKKAGDELNVSLIKNPDIVATIAQQDKRPFMVGFAAETRNVEEYAAGKLVAKKLDMIACNDVSRPDIGFASDENAMTVFFAESYKMEKRDLEKASKQEIALQLVEAIHDALHRDPESDDDF